DRIREHLAGDLDTPAALAEIDAWAGREGDDPDAPALIRDIADALLGVAL
ncbi:MAG TPA: cysteine--1-D-myo-inosityl 2-amino-2-deoxy-alpha-D-glucopyranoside ligase, partial [Thermopolyspora sp.]